MRGGHLRALAELTRNVRPRR